MFYLLTALAYGFAFVRLVLNPWFDVPILVFPGLVTLFFVDGARGDDDLTANGVIVDAGAPAFEALRDLTGLAAVTGLTTLGWPVSFGSG